tara:strand:+ start:3430 stop:3576 length:147 start_codon:yes stop_codon:yes gene_type:complete
MTREDRPAIVKHLTWAVEKQPTPMMIVSGCLRILLTPNERRETMQAPA